MTKQTATLAKEIAKLNLHPAERIYVARTLASVFYQFNSQFDSQGFISRVESEIK